MTGNGWVDRPTVHPFPFEHPADRYNACTPLVGNDRWMFDFVNGYGASVIRGPYTYGGPNLWELAVLGPDGGIDHTTPITDHVIGYLDESGVAEILDRICRLELTP